MNPNVFLPRHRPWRARLRRGLLIYAVVPYLAVVVIFTLLQRQLIYQPTRVASLRATECGLSSPAATDVSLTTNDGLTLHGWLLQAERSLNGDPPFDAPQTPDPLLIYFPGNARHRGHRVSDLKEFTRNGFDVLLFDYRGYGDNPGSPNEAAMEADARLVWKFARDELDAEPGRIVLYGESMGGAVATHLAADLCEHSAPPAALITNATFASLPGTVAWHYPWFPFRYLLWDRWASVERMPQVTCPVLMFHGAKDEIVPLSEGHDLFAAAPGQSVNGCTKRFVELPSCGHNDIPITTLRDELHALLRAILPAAPVAD